MFTLVYVHLIESGIMAHKTEKLCIHVYSQVCFFNWKTFVISTAESSKYL